MTLHIKRAVAAMATVLMLLTLVPTAALPTIQLPDLSAPSAQADTPATDAAVPSTDAPATDAADPSTDAPATDAADPSTDAPATDAAEPSTDAPATDAAVPSTDAPANDAAVPSTDAPATDAAAPSTDAPANNAASGTQTVLRPDVVTDPEIIEDVLTSEDEFVVGEDNTVYVDGDNDGEIEAVQGDVIEDDADFDPTEEIEDLLAGVEQGRVEEPEYLATSDASAASPYEPLVTNDATDPFLPGGDAWIDQDKIYYGAPASPTFPFTDWAANTSFLNTSAYEYDADGRATKWVFPDVDLIDSNTFGSTHQIGSASEGYAYNRNDAAYGKYGVTIDRNRTTTEWTVDKQLYLSETPYLAFSVEQVDKAKLAIAVRIGTPINPKSLSDGYTYRWYTITDSNEHLGINYDSTKKNTVMPSVQISAAGAASPVINDAAYVDGALTGCIDMVYWLPQLDTHLSKETVFHIDKVQVKSEGQAARVNYLYFLNQASTILSPQVNTGSKDLGTKANPTDSNAYASADDLNGWRNAAAVTVTMDGDSNYKVTINSNTSGVRTYKHTDGKEYFDVVIPVRKWMNFSADSRTVQVEMYNAKTGATGATGTGEVEFSMWGNKHGGTPMTYRDMTSATFHSHSLYEDLLFITGHSGNDILQPYCYGSPDAACAQTLEIDQKYNSYYAYGKANLFDFIQSPYMKPAVYVDNSALPNYGWAYVSSFRITVPKGTGSYILASVQTRPIEDGLNDFTKVNGQMVPDENSYDGGTGVQPVVDPGTVSTEPAAFGPHYYSSEYGITDLLGHDNNLNNNSSSSDDTSNIYGLTAKYAKVGEWDASFTTWPHWDNATYTYNTYLPTYITSSYDKYVTFYAKAKVGGDVYYACPVIHGSGKGTLTWAWSIASHYATISSTSGTQSADKLIDLGTYDTLDKFKEKYSTVEAWTDVIYAGMQNKWVWSNLIRGDSGSHFEYDSKRVVNQFNTGEYAPVPLAFTEKRFNTSFNGSNVTYQGMHRMGVWKTDFLYTSYPPSGGAQINANRERILKDAVRVDKDDYLYVDLDIQSNSITNTIQLYFAGANGTIYVFHVNLQEKKFLGFAGNGGQNLPAGTTTVRIPFTSVFTTLAGTTSAFFNTSPAFDGKNGQYLDVIGVSLGYYNGVTSTKYSSTIRRLEVHSKSVKYKDRVETRDDGMIADGFNLLEDACNETLTTEINKTERGRRGWKIRSSYSKNLDTFVFRPTLGHYRIKKVTDDVGQLVLDSDRSFNIEDDYKYLYLSFSMRNTTNNYGLEPTSTGNGISVTLKKYEGENVEALTLNQNGGFTLNETYNSSTVSLKYLPSLNTAVDLSALNMKSLSQIVFSFKGPASTYFYINYMYLSNVPPTAGFQAIAERPFYHNYYLMDNTMGRYSRRFPTTDNPSGQVRSTNPTAADGRVNPLIIKRGQQFWTGTYYNGVPLDEFTSRDGTTYNVATSEESRNRVLASVFFYHDHVDDTSSSDGTGKTGDHLIDQYYKIGEGEKAFEQYEAYWCYNRWPTGWGLDRYIGFEGHHTEGPLMDLHATANNVFLRNGIDPVKYQTTFDTNGGQMSYFGSSDINVDNNGLIENENNYYITNAIITDYFVWPTTNGKLINPVKYGYTFKGWFTESQQENPNSYMQLQLYHTKENPIDITFYAHWTPISGTKRCTATFKKADNSTWFSRQADSENYEIVIPWITQIATSSGSKPLVGWTVQGGDGKVYTPGMKVTLTKDVVFLPYLDTKHESSLTITVNNGAKLCAYTGSMAAADLKPIENGYVGIGVTTSGSTSSQVTTYTNVPRYTVLVAKPYSASDTKGWQVTNTGYTSFSVAGGTSTYTAASYDTYYRFAASTDVTLNYVSQSVGKDAQGAIVWTSPRAYVANRQMMFYTQFDLPDNATAVSYGTLYTKDSQFANIVGSSTSNADIAAKLGAAMQFSSTACSATKTSAVRFIKATDKNESNQYYLMVTENKGNAVTYYARGYVQYKVGSTTYVAYSDIISMASVGASMDPLGG